MWIKQEDLDALTDELLMEAFARDSEGLTAKIYRNVHYQKFAKEARERLENAELSNKIRANEEWCQRHSFNLTEFEMDLREVLKKHHISYMVFYKDAVQFSLANSNGTFHIDGCFGPEREDPEDFANGCTDAWIGCAHTRDR